MKNPGRGWHEQAGVATSTDLKRWTRFEGNPILLNGGPGTGDERFASDPCRHSGKCSRPLSHRGRSRSIGSPPARWPQQSAIFEQPTRSCGRAQQLRSTAPDDGRSGGSNPLCARHLPGHTGW